MTRAQATTHGAVSILSALSSGRGIALGIDLPLQASATVKPGRGSLSLRIVDDLAEDTSLLREVVQQVLGDIRERRVDVSVTTQSQIPIARGLKSSSAAATAAALALLAAIDGAPDFDKAVRLGVEAARRAGVTLTGAWDDAYASCLGGLVFTDNTQGRLIARHPAPENLRVLIHVPAAKRRKSEVERVRFTPLRAVADVAWDRAMADDPWSAMILNGLIGAAVFQAGNTLAEQALTAGALAAGLTGTGPAVAAIVEASSVVAIEAAWQAHSAQVLVCRPHNARAEVVRFD